MLSNSFAFLDSAREFRPSSPSFHCPSYAPPTTSLPLPLPDSSEDVDFRNEVIRRQTQHGQGEGSSSSSSSWSSADAMATPSSPSPFFFVGNGILDHPTLVKNSSSTPQLFAPWETSLSSANDLLAPSTSRIPPPFPSSPTSSYPLLLTDSHDAFLQSQCYGLLQQPVSPPQYIHDCEEPTRQAQQVPLLPSTLFSTSPQPYETATWNSTEGAGGYYQVFDPVDVGGRVGSSGNDLEVDFGDLLFNSSPSSSPPAETPLRIAPTAVYQKSIESEDDLSPMEGVSGFLGEETAFISKLYHIATHPEYARYLRWSQDGSAFCLLNSDDFATKVLPRFFRHSKVNSFLRQLRLYSFTRVSVVITLDPSDAYTSASPKLRRHSLLAQNGDASFELSDSASRKSSSLPTSGDWGTRKVTACGFTHANFNRDNPTLLKLLHPKTQVLKKPRNRSMASKKAAAALLEEEGRKVARAKKTSS